MKGYYDIVGDGGSDVLGQVEAQQKRIVRSLFDVRNLLAIGSGKGGVGKSTMTMQLACALHELGYAVSILDADLNAQVDRLRAAGADVIAVWATPRQFSTAIKHARLDLDWDVPFVLSTVSANEFSVALAGAEVLEGTVSLT